MKGYYVKAKNLATGRKPSIGFDVHKGELACEGLWKEGSESILVSEGEPPIG